MSDWDSDTIKHALTVARSKGFSEVEIQSDAISFRAVLSKAPREAKPEVGESAGPFEGAASQHIKEITAPLVGYFQAAKVPLAVGQKIERGDVIGIIQALGLANDVESNIFGEVSRVLVAPGQSVEFGQVLAEVTVDP
jgi:acetyl-CoA carboxylase biotin carboxyl carrier protein